MTSKTVSNGILRALAIVFGVVVLGYFLWQIQSVIAYLAIAAVVALIGSPIVYFLRTTLKFPNLLAVITTMLLLVGLFAGIIALFVPLLTEQGRNLSLLDIDALQLNLNSLYREITLYFGATPQTFNELILETEIEKNFLERLDVGFIPNFLNTFLEIMSSASIGLFSVLFISFFFLKDRLLLQKGILAFVPKTNEERTTNSISKIKDLLSRYFVGLLLQIFVLFVIYSVTLLLVGIENAIVIAFFAHCSTSFRMSGRLSVGWS